MNASSPSPERYCLAGNAVPSLPGPACSVQVSSPNATYLNRLLSCCKGEKLHFIGNSTDEVPLQQSCIAWCTYPAFVAGQTSSKAYDEWRDCVGPTDFASCQSNVPPTDAAPRIRVSKASLALLGFVLLSGPLAALVAR